MAKQWAKQLAKVTTLCSNNLSVANKSSKNVKDEYIILRKQNNKSLENGGNENERI